MTKDRRLLIFSVGKELAVFSVAFYGFHITPINPNEYLLKYLKYRKITSQMRTSVSIDCLDEFVSIRIRKRCSGGLLVYKNPFRRTYIAHKLQNIFYYKTLIKTWQRWIFICFLLCNLTTVSITKNSDSEGGGVYWRDCAEQFHWLCTVQSALQIPYLKFLTTSTWMFFLFVFLPVVIWVLCSFIFSIEAKNLRSW